MYKKQRPGKTSLKVYKAYTGETLEEKIQRIVNNKTPITDGAPLIYTDRKMGVEAQYNIRTDRFEIAIDAMDKVDKAYKAKREARIKEKEDGKAIPIKEDGKVIPIKKDNAGTADNTSDIK